MKLVLIEIVKDGASYYFDERCNVASDYCLKTFPEGHCVDKCKFYQQVSINNKMHDWCSKIKS